MRMKLSLSAFLLCGVLTDMIAQGRDFSSITVTLSGGMEFVITDSLGRRAGYDPMKRQRYDEINESYGVFSIDSENPEVESPEPVKEFMTHTPIDGRYRLTLFGTKSCRYTLSITLSRGIQDGAEFDFDGVADSNTVQQYEFRYSAVPKTRMTANKIVQPVTLRKDLDQCYTLLLLGGKELHKDLTHRLDKFEKYLAHKDSSKAREELEDFKDKIEDVRKQTVKKEQKKERREKEFLTKDTYQILQEDVDALLKQLPQRRKGKGWDHDDRDRP